MSPEPIATEFVARWSQKSEDCKLQPCFTLIKAAIFNMKFEILKWKQTSIFQVVLLHALLLQRQPDRFLFSSEPSSVMKLSIQL